MSIVNQASLYVEQLFKDKLSSAYLYHNFVHTQNVVATIEAIINYEKIEDSVADVLLVAGWFHDTGYVESTEQHEHISAKIAEEFLNEKGKDAFFIAEVKRLILATQYNWEPKDDLEKIMKDADYSHLGSDSYASSSECLRNEWKLTCGKKVSDLDWNKENLNFLKEKHHFYTDYCQKFLQPIKEKNMKRIFNKIQKMEDNKEDKKGKKKKPDRGIDTMFRVTLNNHTRLSGIADSKANILLSVNAIIISVALSTIVPKLDNPNNAHLIGPTFTMIMFSVVSIIFAILSTRPKVTSGQFTKQDLAEQKVNLLFFGNFYKMPLKEYQEAVNDMINDKDYLYNTMISDLYYLGVVLEKKYRLLRITYNIFMTGIIVSVITFIIAFKTSGY